MFKKIQLESCDLNQVTWETGMDGHLWKPIRIGKMEVKNRLVMPAMGTAFADDEGYVTERLKNHLEARASGGTGLIIVEITYVHPQGRIFLHQLGISDDKFITGMKELTDAVHRHGAKIALQLHHGGSTTKSALTQMQPVGPSAVPFGGGASSGSMSSLGGEIPKELTVEETIEIEGFYAKAAMRAKKAGFDAVELHGAHGYLIDQFLSRTSNKRKDAYGGTLQNRTRFLIEIIKAVKEAVGTDFPVWCRINGKEFGVKGGTSLEEAKEIARMTQDAGADAVHVSAVGPTSPINLTSPTFVPAVIADLAEGIKTAVSVPVIAVAKITPETGERILAEGKADLIAIGRGHLADPDYAKKVATGRLDDITPCILCMKCRDDALDVFSIKGVGIQCSVNAALGKDAEYKIVPAQRPKNVLIIGGGPSGMEAARVSALRGHLVTLWDRGSELGGQLIWAVIAPYKDRINVFRKYLIRQLNQVGVRVVLGKEVTAAMIENIKPEAVVLATGGIPFVPDIQGLRDTDFIQSMDFFQGERIMGKRVLVIGGGLVGCEIAELLAEKGKNVSVIDILPDIASEVGPALREFLLDRLVSKGIMLLPNIKCDQIKEGRAYITTHDGKTRNIEADTIVLAAGFIPDKKLFDQLRGKISDIHLVGDCVKPRSIREAIADGFFVGLQI